MSILDLHLRQRDLIRQLVRCRAEDAEPGWLERRLALRLEIERLDDVIEQAMTRQREREAVVEAEAARKHEERRQKRIRSQQLKEDAQIRTQLKQAQQEWDAQAHDAGTTRPRARIWMHPTEPAEVIPPVPITEGEPASEGAQHVIAAELENRARVLVFHHYASLGRRRSRRYEGFGRHGG